MDGPPNEQSRFAIDAESRVPASVEVIAALHANLIGPLAQMSIDADGERDVTVGPLTDEGVVYIYHRIAIDSVELELDATVAEPFWCLEPLDVLDDVFPVEAGQRARLQVGCSVLADQPVVREGDGFRRLGLTHQLEERAGQAAHTPSVVEANTIHVDVSP